MDRSCFDTAKSTQEKWEELLGIYTEEVGRHVLKEVMKKKKKKDWLYSRFRLVRWKRKDVWNRWRRKGYGNFCEKSKILINEYVRFRREDKINSQKSMIEKRKDNPKLFYVCKGKKMKNQEGINRWKWDSIRESNFTGQSDE